MSEAGQGMVGRGVVQICPLSRPEDGAWTAKFDRVARSAGVPYEYWGWHRGGGAPSGPMPGHHRYLMRGGGRGSIHGRLRYTVWVARVAWSVLRERRDVAYVTPTFDAALGVAVAGLLRKRPLVFANLDNVSLSYVWPLPVRWGLGVLERWVARRAAVHILPSRSRWSEIGRKERIVPNSPTEEQIAAARSIASARGYRRGEVLTVYINGTLTERRGAGTFLRALKRCPPGCLEVLVAGKAKCAEAVELCGLPGVTDLGELSLEESLAEYYRAHLALTYYDPILAINRLAEPNKWEDCIVTGTPFVANAEIETLRRFADRGACFRSVYGDDRGLANLLMEISRDRSRWTEVQARLLEFSTPPWDRTVMEILRELGA